MIYVVVTVKYEEPDQCHQFMSSQFLAKWVELIIFGSLDTTAINFWNSYCEDCSTLYSYLSVKYVS